MLSITKYARPMWIISRSFSEYYTCSKAGRPATITTLLSSKQTIFSTQISPLIKQILAVFGIYGFNESSCPPLYVRFRSDTL